jgi:hypothetical protein
MKILVLLTDYNGKIASTVDPPAQSNQILLIAFSQIYTSNRYSFDTIMFLKAKSMTSVSQKAMLLMQATSKIAISKDRPTLKV